MLVLVVPHWCRTTFLYPANHLLQTGKSAGEVGTVDVEQFIQNLLIRLSYQSLLFTMSRWSHFLILKSSMPLLYSFLTSLFKISKKRSSDMLWPSPAFRLPYSAFSAWVWKWTIYWHLCLKISENHIFLSLCNWCTRKRKDNIVMSCVYSFDAAQKMCTYL